MTADVQARLDVYFQLLTRWNAKINLTALPLRRPTDETFDRLLIEPLAGARYVAESARRWMDVGSGGGSPAIPMKIVHSRAELTMVESKVRKAAFLREAVRVLELPDTDVENQRFEDMAGCIGAHTIDLVSVRAVRNGPSLSSAIHRVLSLDGRAFLFHSAVGDFAVPLSFAVAESVRLGTAGDARLSILRPLFHVEHAEPSVG